jgi:hypothetical protein
MADNVRFHSKHHGKAHHTTATAGYHDSAIDPLASSTSPYMGSFWVSGGNIYTYSMYMSSQDAGATWFDISTKLVSDYALEPRWNSTYSTVYANSADWANTGAAADGFSETFTGDGSEKRFESSYALTSGANVLVTIGGVVQTPVHFDNLSTGHYALSANAARSGEADLIFSTAPANTEPIELRHFNFFKGNDVTNTYNTEYTGNITNVAHGTTNYVQFNSGGQGFGSSSNFVWDISNSRLGIGTNAPTEMLHVSAGVVKIDGKYSGGSAHTDWYNLTLQNSDANNSFYIRNVGDSGESDLSLDDKVYIKESGNVGIGTASPGRKLEVGKIDSDDPGIIRTSHGISDNSRSWDIGTGLSASFGLNDNFGIRDASADATRFVINASGQVGIGTAVPTTLLHMAGGLSIRAKIVGTNDVSVGVESTGSNSQSFLYLTNDARQWSIMNDGAISDIFKIRDTTATADRFVIDSSGNVGIGTTAPGATLTVAGSVSARDATHQHEVLGISVSDETTDLATGEGKTYFRMPYGMTVTDVRANVNTAPVGSTIMVDISGTSGQTIFSTKLTIDAGEKTSTTAAAPFVLSATSMSDDVEMRVGIMQVGSSTAGKGLKLWLIGRRA